MAHTLHGYALGERVEYDSDGRWVPAEIIRLDEDDDDLPLKVSFNDGVTQWVRLSYIRKASGAGRERVLQVRAGGSNWQDIELTADADFSVTANVGGIYVEFRYRPARSAEEIVNKLREHGRTVMLGVDVREILNGEF